MNHIYTKAIRKASEVRIKLGYNLYEPINIYDVCSQLEIDVQFVDVNMEGLYINNNVSSKIILSSLRPFPRRVFTCGHELGHHMFNHGLRVDSLSENNTCLQKSDDELLVDVFSAHLLMPVLCVQTEFRKRNVSLQAATPLDYYAVSSALGVGYQTLVTHCKINRLISELKSIELLKSTPIKIFESFFGSVGKKSFFKIIDIKDDTKPIDLEVTNYIVLPVDFEVDTDFFEKKMQSDIGTLFHSKKVGITSIHSVSNDKSCFIRIQPQNYIGFAEYRHLEN